MLLCRREVTYGVERRPGQRPTALSCTFGFHVSSDLHDSDPLDAVEIGEPVQNSDIRPLDDAGLDLAEVCVGDLSSPLNLSKAPAPLHAFLLEQLTEFGRHPLLLLS